MEEVIPVVTVVSSELSMQMRLSILLSSMSLSSTGVSSMNMVEWLRPLKVCLCIIVALVLDIGGCLLNACFMVIF